MDEIIELIIKEARSRPGKDLERKIYRVIAEAHVRLMMILDNLADQEREDNTHEK